MSFDIRKQTKPHNQEQANTKITYFRNAECGNHAMSPTLGTVIHDTLKIGQKYSTVPRAQERVSERSGTRERSEQCGASDRVSGASEQASG